MQDILRENNGGGVTFNRQRIITIPWPTRSDVPVSEFARHPYFKFVAHNMIMRKKNALEKSIS